MLKLTLTTDDSGPALDAQVALVAKTLGVDVEAVGIDGYVASSFVHPKPSVVFSPTPLTQFQPTPVAPPVEDVPAPEPEPQT